MKKLTYATVISCMDGRIQEPLREFAPQKFGVNYVDVITDRGGLLRNLAHGNRELTQNILENLRVSLEVHESKGIVVAGHQKCAGYIISDAEKRKEVIQAAELIRKENSGVEANLAELAPSGFV